VSRRFSVEDLAAAFAREVVGVIEERSRLFLEVVRRYRASLDGYLFQHFVRVVPGNIELDGYLDVAGVRVLRVSGGAWVEGVSYDLHRFGGFFAFLAGAEAAGENVRLRLYNLAFYIEMHSPAYPRSYARAYLHSVVCTSELAPEVAFSRAEEAGVVGRLLARYVQELARVAPSEAAKLRFLGAEPTRILSPRAALCFRPGAIVEDDYIVASAELEVVPPPPPNRPPSFTVSPFDVNRPYPQHLGLLTQGARAAVARLADVLLQRRVFGTAVEEPSVLERAVVIASGSAREYLSEASSLRLVQEALDAVFKRYRVEVPDDIKRAVAKRLLGVTGKAEDAAIRVKKALSDYAKLAALAAAAEALYASVHERLLHGRWIK